MNDVIKNDDVQTRSLSKKSNDKVEIVFLRDVIVDTFVEQFYNKNTVRLYGFDVAKYCKEKNILPSAISLLMFQEATVVYHRENVGVNGIESFVLARSTDKYFGMQQDFRTECISYYGLKATLPKHEADKYLNQKVFCPHATKPNILSEVPVSYGLYNDYLPVATMYYEKAA